jgi:hypothetical protein
MSALIQEIHMQYIFDITNSICLNPYLVGGIVLWIALGVVGFVLMDIFKVSIRDIKGDVVDIGWVLFGPFLIGLAAALLYDFYKKEHYGE